MSKYVIDSSTLTSIADAVRAKTGSSRTIKVSDIPSEIDRISGSGIIPALKDIYISNNGTYDASDEGVDGYNSIVVNVPQDGTASLDTITITRNGIYPASSSQLDGFSEVIVNVPQEGQAVVDSITIDRNGTYHPDVGIDGFNEVVVNVPQEINVPSELLNYSGDCGYKF